MESLDSLELEEVLRLIPGYDPFTSAGDSWLDHEAAQNAIDFFCHPERGCLKHIEGDMSGQPFVLGDWQKAIVGNLFGWKRKDNYGRIVRRYRECFLYVPRKNGKTPLAAGIGVYVLFCDDESGQQNYIAAADKEQAGALFRHAKGMVEAEPELSDRCQVYGGTAPAGQSKSIVIPKDGSFLRVVSADADTKHGGNSHLVIIDELHAQKNGELVDVLTTSTASKNRKQPLVIYITTADYNRESVCNKKYDYAKRVRDGLPDPQFLPVIYEAGKDDDWMSPEVWAKANPNLDISVSRDYLERECAKAKQEPSHENTVKRLHLNIQTDADEVWMPIWLWDVCKVDQEEADLEGLRCYGGLDLSSVMDVCAFVASFPGDPVAIVPRFWIPEAKMHEREKRDRLPWSTWARQGFVTVTKGDTVDYAVIRRDINELSRKFDMGKILVDRWNASQLVNELIGDGFDLEFFGQGFASMSAPARHLEKLLAEQGIAHLANPIMRNMMQVVAVERDAADNIKPSKKKSTDRIDGVVALIMSLAPILSHQDYDASAPPMFFMEFPS